MYYIFGGVMKYYTILENTILIDYLENNLKISHKDVKNLFKYKLIEVNGKTITKFDYNLKKDDHLCIFNVRHINDKIEILYEDSNIIVVNKPSLLLTIANNREKDRTLYHIVSDYVKKNNNNSKIFVIHRLDYETSGIVMFAKSEKIKELYQSNWNNLVKYRGYTCMVEGNVEKDSDSIKLYLAENKSLFVYVSNKEQGREAITNYKVKKRFANKSLLDVEILTGRRNQIRVSMQYIGHPIIGDLKYGSHVKNKYLLLCANKLIITNPLNNKDFNFEVNVPSYFK